MDGYQPKARGRPKDPHRRARILESAKELFLEHGMQAVSVEAIAEHAEVSNRTVYSHFASKQELLWAVVVQAAEPNRPVFTGGEVMKVADLRNQLIDFGIALVTLLTSPTIMKLGNLIVSEAARHPDLAQQFYDWGPRSGQRAMEGILASAVRRKLIADDASSQLAHYLLSMLHGTWHHEQQLGLAPPMTKPRVKKYVVDCVDFFLKAVQR